MTDSGISIWIGIIFFINNTCTVYLYVWYFSVGCTNDDDEEEARERRRRAREERKKMRDVEDSGATDVINTNRYNVDEVYE